MLLLNAALPADFFTQASFATLAGCTGAVLVICNTIQRVFNYNPQWLALFVSLAISLSAAAVAKESQDGALKYVVALLNGCLIYTTAVGSNQIIGSAPPTPPVKDLHANAAGVYRTRPLPLPRRKFFTRWLN